MPDISDMLEDAVDFAESYCLEQGDPDAGKRLSLRIAGNRILFSIERADLCGSSISGFLVKGREHRTMRQCLSRIMRQRARDRIIAASGEEGTPVWSLDIGRMAHTVLVRAGINPLLLASHDPGYFRRQTSFDDAVDASPLMMTAEIRAGRVFLPTISVRPGADMDDSIHLCELESSGGDPCLAITGRTLPDSVATDLVGKAVSDLVDHPLVTGDGHPACDTRIRSVVNDDGCIIARLDDDRTTLAPLPDGLEAEWLRFPWNP